MIDTVEQSLSASEPAGTARPFAPEQKAVADPEAAPHGPGCVTQIEKTLMRALEAGDVIGIAADHVRRTGQELQVRRLEQSQPINFRESLVGLLPSFLTREAATKLEGWIFQDTLTRLDRWDRSFCARRKSA